ncbi:MAG: M23 family metallopeptidase [Acidobacteria bacterium]|nr:M23 family metallopeptidase [Acidobacteriota bacterium]
MRPLRSLLPALLLAATSVPAALTPTVAPPALSITHRARALHPGELVVLTIESTAPLTAIDVRAFGRTEHVREFPASTATAYAWQSLIGIDLDVRAGRYDVSVSATSESGLVTATYPLEIAAKAFPTRRLNVDPNFVNPPASAAARIAAEAAELARVWPGTSVPIAPGPLTFITPVPHRANSAFGRRSIFNGEPRSAHGGADFLSPTGTPIKAPAPGRVVLAKDLYYTGGTVVIDHGLGIISLFAHLSATTARAGDALRAGTVVGQVGATGRVTGPHLHWTVRVNGARVDPLSLLALLGPA